MKKRSRFAYVFQEIAIVVIGVLIAVSVGNYKEKMDNQKYLAKTLLAIENEIKLSQADIDTVLGRHLELYETMENKLGENEETLADILIGSGGFQVASIKNVSLRFFISNKAELLEFGLISDLLDIEFSSEILSEKIKRISDFANEHLNDRNEDTKLKFSYLLSDVIEGEQALLKAYSNFLNGHKTYFTDPPK